MNRSVTAHARPASVPDTRLLHGPLVRLGMRQITRTRKFAIALIVSAMPLVAGLIMLVSDLAKQGQPGWMFHAGYSETMAFLVLSGTVPFVALLLAGGMLADEAEDRTLTYLLVRPVRRATLYLSKLLPVLAITAGLAAAQALVLGIMRLLAFAIAGDGAVESVGDGTIGSGVLLMRTVPVGMLSAALLGATMAAVFGVVTLVATRFHFFANLLLFLVWELGLSRLGGLGKLTITHYALSLLQKADPTLRADELLESASGIVFAVVWLLLWLGLWSALGAGITRRRDFNITSAAS